MIARSFFATFRTIAADRSALLLLIGAVILYSFFYPTAYSGEVATRIPVVVVDMDHSGLSRAFVQKLADVQQADLVGSAASPADALRWIRDRRAIAAVVVPPQFERAIMAGGQGNVALYGNGAFLLRSANALGGIGAALGAIGREAAHEQAMALGAPAPPALTLVARPLFNTREGYGSTVFPGVTFVIIQQTLLMGLAMLAATMREKQGALRFAPRALLGIALAFFVIGALSIVYFVGFVFWFQDYPRAQAGLCTLAVSGVLFVGATVAGSLALASFFRTRERPVQLWIVTSVPIFFLSGLSWPTFATPGWLALLARLLPTTPGIRLMIGVNQMGASLAEQWVEVVNLAVLIILYGTIATVRFSPRRDHRHGIVIQKSGLDQ